MMTSSHEPFSDTETHLWERMTYMYSPPRKCLVNLFNTHYQHIAERLWTVAAQHCRSWEASYQHQWWCEYCNTICTHCLISTSDLMWSSRIVIPSTGKYATLSLTMVQTDPTMSRLEILFYVRCFLWQRVTLSVPGGNQQQNVHVEAGIAKPNLSPLGNLADSTSPKWFTQDMKTFSFSVEDTIPSTKLEERRRNSEPWHYQFCSIKYVGITLLW